MATSQDHKRLLDDDQGPNTGGMGAQPGPGGHRRRAQKVMERIILPTVRGYAGRWPHLYTGFLYAGLMIDAHGDPYTIEFNCRFGDPETQPIMARLASDFTVLLEAGIDGKLDTVSADWDPRVAMGVVLAAAGYPDAPQGRRDHRHPAATADSVTFHAGTAFNADGQLVQRRRVLCAVGLGDTVQSARETALRRGRRHPV